MQCQLINLVLKKTVYGDVTCKHFKT